MAPLQSQLSEPLPDTRMAEIVLAEFYGNYEKEKAIFFDHTVTVESLEELREDRGRRRLTALKGVLESHMKDIENNRTQSNLVFNNLLKLLEAERDGHRVDNNELQQLVGFAITLRSSYRIQSNRVAELIKIALELCDKY